MHTLRHGKILPVSKENTDEVVSKNQKPKGLEIGLELVPDPASEL